MSQYQMHFCAKYFKNDGGEGYADGIFQTEEIEFDVEKYTDFKKHIAKQVGVKEHTDVIITSLTCLGEVK